MGKGGLEDVVAASSAICDVDGTAGKLVYCGYDIHDLAEHSTFEEVTYLLWNGCLPTKPDLEALNHLLTTNRALPPEVIEAMKKFPKEAMPMEALRTTVSMLSMYDKEAEDMNTQANMRKAVKLTAKIPTIVAYIDLIRNGKTIVPPKQDGSLAENFLYMLSGGKVPNETAVKSLDIALILHADHELNASTFAARVAAATLTDFYSATVAAIGALKGPLHGGANQEVIKMLIEMGSVDNVMPHLEKMFANHEKVMGFGHRVYKTEDPRATHLRKMSEELGKRSGETKWYEMSHKVEEQVKADKHLNANVDFYSASVYYMLGIPIDLYTPIFAMSRMAGWAAHILEQYANNRLIRPRAEYIGKRDLEWVPFEKRHQLEAMKK
jgi:citrate synthase